MVENVVLPSVYVTNAMAAKRAEVSRPPKGNNTYTDQAWSSMKESILLLGSH